MVESSNTRGQGKVGQRSNATQVTTSLAVLLAIEEALQSAVLWSMVTEVT